MLHRVVGLLFLAQLQFGCGGDDPVADEDVTGATAHGWVSEVVLAPASFGEVIADGREGWIALHANQLVEAARLLPTGAPRSRAEWRQAILHGDLARVSALAHDQLFSTWESRTGLPAGSAAPLVATLAAGCADGGTPSRWAGGVEGDEAELAAAVGSGARPWSVRSEGPFGARLALHAEARDGRPEALMAVAQQPVLNESGEGFERTFFDPCLHRTLADTWSARAARSVGGEDWRAIAALDDAGVGGRLFSPWLTEVAIGEATSAGLVATLPPALTPSLTEDEPQAARERVRALDAELGRWRAALDEAAPEEGRALLVELGLLERYRQQILLVEARRHLHADRPLAAWATLELARDVSSREIGPTNAPEALALLAEAALLRGRTREALDALHILVQAHPEVVGLQEVTGDLAVLQGLDRHGDSKEN